MHLQALSYLSGSASSSGSLGGSSDSSSVSKSAIKERSAFWAFVCIQSRIDENLCKKATVQESTLSLASFSQGSRLNREEMTLYASNSIILSLRSVAVLGIV